LIAASPALLARAEATVEDEFGPITLRSAITPFNFTSYYQKEMGKGLLRQWLGLKGTVPSDRLADLKLAAISRERTLSLDGKRQVNIDPGLLSLHSLVLASTKNFAHRVYLRDGIHAEVTLIFQAGQFRPLEWTYPDYRTETCLRFLTACREELLADLART